MFTGLIQHIGTVSGRSDGPGETRLLIDSKEWTHVVEPGESISVNGCCLTVAGLVHEVMAFDVVPTTLEATTLGTFNPGMKVNLEHAATPSTLLGGHLVQGHVDATGSVLANGVEGEAGWLLRLEVPEGVARYMTDKGSIAVDGVSLTIAEIESNQVTIALVPETLLRTTLGDLPPGGHVNLETDCLVKMVDALLERDRRGRS